MDIKKECRELNVNINDICKLTTLGQLIQKAKHEINNTKDDIFRVLKLLRCTYLLSNPEWQIYKNLDINDKEVQYKMLDHDAKLCFNINEIDLDHILIEMCNELEICYTYKKRRYIKEYFIMINVIIDDIKNIKNEYKKFKPNQYNISNYINDSCIIEKKLKEIINHKTNYNITQYSRNIILREFRF